MKKIITLICFIFLLSLIPSTVFASEYESLIDSADLITSEDEQYLQSRIDGIKEEYDYNITLVSGEFENEDAFSEYCDNFYEYDSNADGAVLIFGEYGENYNYYSISYGEYTDVLNNAIFAEFEEFDASSETYAESYEMYVTLVQIFLEEQEAIPEVVSEETPQETSETVEDTAALFGPMIDEADLFSEKQEEVLLARIEEIHNTYDFDVTIITLNEIPDDSYDLRDYFDWYEGLDPTRDGLVVGVNMDESNREFSISARNFGMEAFNDDAHEVIDKEVPPLLTDEEYYNAFNLFLDYTEEFLSTAKAGEAYKKPVDIFTIMIFVVALPLILAFIIAWLIVKFVFVAQMKTAVIQTQAKEFMTKDSLALTINSDVFTHQTEKREYDPPSENKSGGRSGSSGYGGGRSGSSSSF